MTKMKKSTMIQIIGIVIFLFVIVILLFTTNIFTGKEPEKEASNVKNGENVGYQGMILDYVNETVMEIQGQISRELINGSENVTLSGWAADFTVYMPLSSLSVKIGDNFVNCTYGTERTSVADYFGNSNLTMTGFEVTIPKSYFDGVDKVEFVQISNDGNTTFEYVVYNLIN